MAARRRESVLYRRRPRYLAARPRRAVVRRPGGRGYAPRRRGASWIPALLIILLLVGAGVLAWMFLSDNDDGSTGDFSPVPSVVSQVTI